MFVLPLSNASVPLGALSPLDLRLVEILEDTPKRDFSLKSGKMDLDDALIPARRRRHSGSADTNGNYFPVSGSPPCPTEPTPRPKSTPGERCPVEHNNGATSRPTKPLPSSKTRTLANSHAPVPIMANPSMLPIQAHVPRGGVATSNRRLFVVLEQACLEAYRISGGSTGSKGRGGKGEGEVKYTLLNCDDHQGILAKTGRDIADARPDITHQVRRIFPVRSLLTLLCFIHSAC